MATAWILLMTLACNDKQGDDTGTGDGGAMDAGGTDGGGSDGGGSDGGGSDGGGSDGGGSDGGGTDGGGTDGGGTDGGGTDGGGTDGGTDCTATVESFHPTTGSVDVPLDTTVSATLRGTDATAVIELYAASGARVDGALHIEEGLVAFTPNAPLLPDTGYQATMDWCGGYEVWSFVTAASGTISDPTGMVYHLDLGGAEWVEPPGVGSILASSMSNLLLLKVLSYDTTLELRLAWSDEMGLRQDLCMQTVDETVTDLTGLPAFGLGPSDGTLAFGAEELVLRDRWLRASFTEDLSELEGASLGGTADMRDWVDVLGPMIGTDDPADICDLMSSFGAGCGPCADGGSFCLDAQADEIPAEAGWIKVEERTAEDIAADPRCR